MSFVYEFGKELIKVAGEALSPTEEYEISKARTKALKLRANKDNPSIMRGGAKGLVYGAGAGGVLGAGAGGLLGLLGTLEATRSPEFKQRFGDISAGHRLGQALVTALLGAGMLGTAGAAAGGVAGAGIGGGINAARKLIR